MQMHLAMNVPAVTSWKTLDIKSEATLVSQTL